MCGTPIWAQKRGVAFAPHLGGVYLRGLFGRGLGSLGGDRSGGVELATDLEVRASPGIQPPEVSHDAVLAFGRDAARIGRGLGLGAELDGSGDRSRGFGEDRVVELVPQGALTPRVNLRHELERGLGIERGTPYEGEVMATGFDRLASGALTRGDCDVES